jgi:DNA-binding transcriptional LysR family regulator
MDLLGLRVLREVARCGSISAAADALDYTQPAVSRQLAALERSAGRPLVERTARGTRLTRPGEVLLRRAEAVLTELEGARADLDSLGDHEERPLRILGFQTAIASFVPDALGALRRRFPDAAVELRLGEARVGDAALRGDRLDVALTNATSWTFPDARVHPLREDPMWCVLPAGHRLAGRDEIAFEALRDEPFVLTSTTLCADRELVLDACAAHGFVPRVAAHCDDPNTTQGLVAAGVGVAALPEMGLPVLRDDVVLRPFARPLKRRVVALVPRDAPARPERDALLEALADAAGAWRSPVVPTVADSGGPGAVPPVAGGEDGRSGRAASPPRTGRAVRRAQTAVTPVRSYQADSGSPVIRS